VHAITVIAPHVTGFFIENDPVIFITLGEKCSFARQLKILIQNMQIGMPALVTVIPY